MKNRIWLSVDTDDFQYLPSVQGHKSRSKGKSIDLAKYNPSENLIQGFAGFRLWMNTNDFPVTIFVISSQLENEKFRTLLSDVIEEFPDRITLAAMVMITDLGPLLNQTLRNFRQCWKNRIN